MNVKLAIITIAVTAGLAACGGQSPESVAKDFYQFASDGKPDESLKLIHPKAKNDWGKKMDAAVNGMTEDIKRCGGAKEINLSPGVDKGESKVFDVTLIYKNGDQAGCKDRVEKTTVTKGEDGKWYVYPG